MKKYLLSMLSLSLPVLSLSGGLWSEAQAEEWMCKIFAHAGEAAEPNEFIVKYRNPEGARRGVLRDLGGEESEISSDAPNVKKLTGSFSEDEETFCQKLLEEGEVEYIYPNYRLKSEGRPNDPEFPQQWGLEKIGMVPAWDITTGTEVVIAVIDSGIDYNHPDLAANMWNNPGEIPGNGIDDDGNGRLDDVYGYDFANADSDPMDDNRHGTHCAGIIAAVGNNNLGMTGINWSAKLMAVKFSSSYGIGTEEKAIAAIDYAVREGAKIISASWGGTGGLGLKEAIQRARDKGILFVSSAGNSSEDTDNGSPHYPSNYDLENIISVAATDQNDEIAKTSNYGAISVDLGAPGVDIFSTVLGGEYKKLSGTSMAAPHVTGVAALILATKPTFTFREVKDRILASVDPVPSLAGKTVTGGRLNAYKAIGTPPPPPPVAVCTTSGTDMTVTFDGTGSHKEGGNIINYAWSISPPVDLSTPGEKLFTHNFSQAGTYVATLTVTDDVGLTATTKCQVTVPTSTIGSAPLTADFVASWTPPTMGSEESEEESETVSCKCTWTMCKKNPYGECESKEGTISEDCQFSRTFDSEGTYRLTPTVTCDGQTVSTKDMQVNILPSLGGGFAGGVSINKASYQTKVTQKLSDTVEVIGEIKPANPIHVSQTVDIVVYADYPTPEGTLSFMLDSNGWPLLWDKNPANLVAFKPQVTLTSPHLVPMYTGQFVLPGHLLVYFGYRLADGTVVSSNNPIDITINE